MNVPQIATAVSWLAAQSFNANDFPFDFLEAFGNNAVTLKKLRSGDANKSDIGGVLQRKHIHLKVCAPGEVATTLALLRESAATTKWGAKFVLATDGQWFEAENLSNGETVVCDFPDFHEHFVFFLPLAGISIVKQISDNPFDIKATLRLNRLYIELLKDNPDWATQNEALNHFFARLIFCFFAEDTGIFQKKKLFSDTLAQVSDISNTHEVLSELFRAMSTQSHELSAAGIPLWARVFPYVNGGLFSGDLNAPRFSRVARSHLLHIGALDWTKINPDIFGSMIQAVADDEERGALGMHYTSVPNILKVLNPLFLDDLRAKLSDAGDNARKLLNLRKRMALIRVFDPACGSGNFLVIAYKEMREIEAEINRRRGEATRKSEIPIKNFRGIELRHFSCEIARLALIIAEYQCDELYRGHDLALLDFLPLKAENWITHGNALRLDWPTLFPSEGIGVKIHAHDLFSTPLDQAEMDFENAGGETYICGNPPYLGSTWQSAEQKDDLKGIFEDRTNSWRSLDYVAGWFLKAADYGTKTHSAAAFVSTNSICQGQQVPILWPLIFGTGHEISFAHTSFKWANLAAYNAGVTVAIVGISNHPPKIRRLFSIGEDGKEAEKEVENINPYLVPGPNFIVEKASKPLSGQSEMSFGNKPVDGGNLLLSAHEAQQLKIAVEKRRDMACHVLDEREGTTKDMASHVPTAHRATSETPDGASRDSKEGAEKFIRRIYGSAEFIRGLSRYCLWIPNDVLEEAQAIEPIRKRIEAVRAMRLGSRDKSANDMAARAHQFREMNTARHWTIVVPRTSSESRPLLPSGLIDSHSTVTSEAFALYDAPLWNLAIIASRLHLVWIATVCGKLKTDFRYSNTLGWNTFPVPFLTAQNKADLTRSAEDILLAREHHFPATIADLYAPGAMPEDLRHAHSWNDEVLERIYIGRRFKNDTERLEKLFALYSQMVTKRHL